MPLYLLAREVARARDHRGRDRRGRRRAVLGLRPVQGGRRCASSTARDPERAEALLDELYPYLGPRRRPARPRDARRFLLETGADDPLLGSHLTRATATGAVKALYRPEVAAAIGGRRLARAAARRRCPAGVRRLERARARRLARADDAARALPARGPGRPGGDGARRRGPLPVPRPPRLRARGRAAGRAQARRHCATRSRCASSPRGCCPPGSPRRAKQPYRAPGGRAVLRRRRPGLGRGGALRRRARRRPGSGTPSGSRACCGAAEAGRATGMREGMALVGVLSTQLWHRQFVGVARERYPAETAEPRVRIDRTADGRSEGSRMSGGDRRRAQGHAGLHRGQLPLPAPRRRAGRRRRLCSRSGSSTRSASSSWSRRSRRATGSTIDDVEITEENFGSIDAIAGFVERKQAAA